MIWGLGTVCCHSMSIHVHEHNTRLCYSYCVTNHHKCSGFSNIPCCPTVLVVRSREVSYGLELRFCQGEFFEIHRGTCNPWFLSAPQGYLSTQPEVAACHPLTDADLCGPSRTAISAAKPLKLCDTLTSSRQRIAVRALNASYNHEGNQHM